jgi:hypothetical protein
MDQDQHSPSVRMAGGRDPSLKILVASYGEDLAEELAGTFRRTVARAWYQRLFPATRIDPRKNRALDIGTTRGGGRRSLGGALTGFGADIIIVDDLLNLPAHLCDSGDVHGLDLPIRQR